MKHITLPEPSEGIGVDPQGRPALLRLSLDVMVRECLGRPYWRQGSADRIGAAIRVAEAFAAAGPASTVELSDSDHEMLCVAMRAEDQTYAPGAALAVLRQLVALYEAK